MSSVDELTGVHAFDGDEVLSALLVFVNVSENNLGEGGTTASIVNDVSDDTLDVSEEEVRYQVNALFRLGHADTLLRNKVLTPFSR